VRPKAKAGDAFAFSVIVTSQGDLTKKDSVQGVVSAAN
jgi:hypothetical protein